MSPFKSCRQLIVLSTLCVAGGAQANLLSNGSFESGAFVNQGNQTMSLAVGATTISGWTVTNDVLAWINVGNPFGLSANDGDKFLDLTDYSFGAPFGGVSQSIATMIGGQYLLAFDLGSSTQYGRPSGILASAGNASANFTSSPLLNGSDDWERFTLSFTATTVMTTVSLAGSAGGSYIGLDNVEVTLISQTIPEPGSVALMLAGLGIVAASVRRRRD